jgi:hypothetical protein
LFDYLRKFNNESREHSKIKPARDLLRDEKSVVKAEIRSALSISRGGAEARGKYTERKKRDHHPQGAHLMYSGISFYIL